MNDELKQDLNDQIAHGLFTENEQDELTLADFSDEIYDDDEEDYDMFDMYGGDGYGI